MIASRRSFLFSAAVALSSRAASTDDDGNMRLVLDSRNIEQVENLQLSLGSVRKEPRNPLFGEEHPWEARFDNLSPNVLFDSEDGIYKCWYSPFIIDQRTTSTPREKRATQNYIATRPAGREMGVCYATSEDGLRWTKPSLGLVEFNGSKANNLLVRRQGEAGVFKDSRDPNPSRRYKMVTRARTAAGETMAVRFSPDGVVWPDAIACPEIESPGDTHNNALWAPDRNAYVLFTRLRSSVPGARVPKDTPEDVGNRMATHIRTVGRAESRDFEHWTKAVEVLRGLEPGRQTYAMPVFRYANLYLGLPAIFDTESDTVNCELAWSPDSVRWERISSGTPLIPRGSKPSYDCGCIYAAAAPVIRDAGIQIYYLGANGYHTSWREGSLNLARLGIDRFAGYQNTGCGCAGRLVTRSLRISQPNLCVTADCRGGSLKASILGEDGHVLAVSEALRSDVTRSPLRWRKAWDPSAVTNRPVRIEFQIAGAKLYSFSF